MRTTIKTPEGHIHLNVKRLTASLAIDPEKMQTMNRAQLDSHIDNQTGKLILQLSARIAGKEIETKRATYPSDWWQGFKIACLPTICRLFNHTPKLTTIELTASAFYPSLRVPNHKPFVQVTLSKNSDK